MNSSLVSALGITIHEADSDSLMQVRAIIETHTKLWNLFLTDSSFASPEYAVEYCDILCGYKIREIGFVNVQVPVSALSALVGQFICGLTLDSCNLTDASLPCLFDGLKRSPRLAELNIPNNAIGPNGITMLASVLPETQVSILNLRGNPVGHETVDELIYDGCRLLMLNVGFCNIGRNGAEKLCAKIRQHGKKLRGLDISGNNIDSSKGVSEMISSEESIVNTIFMNNNPIRDIEVFGEALVMNKTMSYVFLESNPELTDASVLRAFVYNKRLALHPELRYIYIHDTTISRHVRDQLNQFIESIHSRQTEVLIALCSAKNERLGTNSPLGKYLPTELIRMLPHFISWGRNND